MHIPFLLHLIPLSGSSQAAAIFVPLMLGLSYRRGCVIFDGTMLLCFLEAFYWCWELNAIDYDEIEIMREGGGGRCRLMIVHMVQFVWQKR